MLFGQRVRELRRASGLSLRGLAAKVGVGFTYLSRVENEKLEYGDYPSDALIARLAQALNGDADELLILAKKVPPRIRQRVLERPDVFRKLAQLDDEGLDRVVRCIIWNAPGRNRAESSHTPFEREAPMSRGFLLRFEEVMARATEEGTAKTRTFVEKEKPDEGLTIPLAGTKTTTEVQREAPDNDPGSRTFYVLPH